LLLHNFQLTPQEVVAHGNAWYLLVTRTTLACFESRYLQKDVDHQHLEAYPASKLCVWNLIVRQGEARIESFHPAILFLFGRSIHKRMGVLMSMWVPIAGPGPVDRSTEIWD